jgi:hypothetical protein
VTVSGLDQLAVSLTCEVLDLRHGSFQHRPRRWIASRLRLTLVCAVGLHARLVKNHPGGCGFHRVSHITFSAFSPLCAVASKQPAETKGPSPVSRMMALFFVRLRRGLGYIILWRS